MWAEDYMFSKNDDLNCSDYVLIIPTYPTQQHQKKRKREIV